MRLIMCPDGDLKEEDFIQIRDFDREKAAQIDELMNRKNPWGTDQAANEVALTFDAVGEILRKPFPPLLSPKIIPKSLVDLYYDDYIAFFRTNLKAKKLRERCIIAYSIVKNFYDLIPFIEKLYKQSLWSKYDAKSFPTEYMDYIKDLDFIKKCIFNSKSRRILRTCHEAIDDIFTIEKKPMDEAIKELDHYRGLISDLGKVAKKWVI